MEQILTQTNNKVDAVLAMNDGTAGGVAAALALAEACSASRSPARTATRRR